MRTILYVVEEPGRHEQLVQIGDDVLINSRWFPGGWYQVEVKRKLVGGVRFHFGIAPSYDEAHLLQDLEQKGFFSARPFTLEHAYDPSVDACTATFYVSFCRAHHLDPVGLFRQAYPSAPGKRFIDPLFPLTEHIARWEGITLPSYWSRTQFHHLLRLLKPQRKLATLLTQTPIGKRLR